MANTFFNFKQFTVWQDKCAMKVGTDGVLLGAWAENNHIDSILDIGTGTGLVALMLAQRFQAKVTAIEIDKDAYLQASENIKDSPWDKRIDIIHTDFKDFYSLSKYDLIVCNPPYFVDSLQSSDVSRTVARHNETLTYEDLIEGASRLLASSGRLCIIIPADATNKIIATAKEHNLFPQKLTHVITTPGKSPKRSLISLGFNFKEYETNELLIEVERHTYSEDFINLVKDFYIKM